MGLLTSLDQELRLRLKLRKSISGFWFSQDHSLRSLSLQPGHLLAYLLSGFVDGLQKATFPSLPAIQATWLQLLPWRDFHPLETNTLP